MYVCMYAVTLQECNDCLLLNAHHARARYCRKEESEQRSKTLARLIEGKREDEGLKQQHIIGVKNR